MGCMPSKGSGADSPPSFKYTQQAMDPDSPNCLAKETIFNLAEIDALQHLYDKLANEFHHDGLIHKDEFMWALFKANKNNLFAERVFQVFDIKRNNVIEFGEFVRSLSVFHPNAPLEEKAAFAFRIYDIEGNGYIEKFELKRFLVALMADNPDIDLDADALDTIVDQTFHELDLVKDGRINPEEWTAIVQRNQTMISYMTLPVLTQVCQLYGGCLPST